MLMMMLLMMIMLLMPARLWMANLLGGQYLRMETNDGTGSPRLAMPPTKAWF